MPSTDQRAIADQVTLIPLYLKPPLHSHAVMDAFMASARASLRECEGDRSFMQDKRVQKIMAKVSTKLALRRRGAYVQSQHRGIVAVRCTRI